MVVSEVNWLVFDIVLMVDDAVAAVAVVAVVAVDAVAFVFLVVDVEDRLDT